MWHVPRGHPRLQRLWSYKTPWMADLTSIIKIHNPSSKYSCTLQIYIYMWIPLDKTLMLHISTDLCLLRSWIFSGDRNVNDYSSEQKTNLCVCMHAQVTAVNCYSMNVKKKEQPVPGCYLANCLPHTVSQHCWHTPHGFAWLCGALWMWNRILHFHFLSLLQVN